MPNEVKRREEISSTTVNLDNRGQHRNRVVKSRDFERRRSLEKPSSARTNEPHVNVTP